MSLFPLLSKPTFSACHPITPANRLLIIRANASMGGAVRGLSPAYTTPFVSGGTNRVYLLCSTGPTLLSYYPQQS